jgi:hypothetical protein
MKNREQDRLNLARRIRAAGRPIYIAEDDELAVSQAGGAHDSSAFEWGDGTGFKVCLTVTNHLPTSAISRFELELPWKQTYFQWLEEAVARDGKSPCYRFAGNPSLEFESSLVINHYADVTNTLSAGQSMKGVLLGFGRDPIPEEFPHGSMIPASVRIYDQREHKYVSPVNLWVDRNKKNVRAPRWTERRKGGLLDKRDKIEVS